MNASGDTLGECEGKIVQGTDHHDLLLDHLSQQLSVDGFWSHYLATKINCSRPSQNLHLGVFVQPFLQWIFDGTKTVESRFSKNDIVPYQHVLPGDVLLMKEAGGPVTGIALADGAWFYRLDPTTLSFVKARFSELIGSVNDEFWSHRQDSRFATFISLSSVRRLSPIPYKKSDRRGWLLEREKYSQMSLDL